MQRQGGGATEVLAKQGVVIQTNKQVRMSSHVSSDAIDSTVDDIQTIQYSDSLWDILKLTWHTFRLPFNQRISRGQFCIGTLLLGLIFSLFFFLLTVLAPMIFSDFSGQAILVIIIKIIVVVGGLLYIYTLCGLFVKRANDLNKSRLFALGLIIPFWNIYILLKMYFELGFAGKNRYGKDPLTYQSQSNTGYIIVFVLYIIFSITIRSFPHFFEFKYVNDSSISSANGYNFLNLIHISQKDSNTTTKKISELTLREANSLWNKNKINHYKIIYKVSAPMTFENIRAAFFENRPLYQTTSYEIMNNQALNKDKALNKVEDDGLLLLNGMIRNSDNLLNDLEKNLFSVERHFLMLFLIQKIGEKNNIEIISDLRFDQAHGFPSHYRIRNSIDGNEFRTFDISIVPLSNDTDVGGLKSLGSERYVFSPSPSSDGQIKELEMRTAVNQIYQAVRLAEVDGVQNINKNTLKDYLSYYPNDKVKITKISEGYTVCGPVQNPLMGNAENYGELGVLEAGSFICVSPFSKSSNKYNSAYKDNTNEDDILVPTVYGSIDNSNCIYQNDRSIDSQCLFEIESKIKNENKEFEPFPITKCESIEDIGTKYYCLRVHYAILQDIRECDNELRESDSFTCRIAFYQKRALKNNSINDCKMIRTFSNVAGFTNYLDNCLYLLAQRNNNYVACEDIVDYGRKEYCIVEGKINSYIEEHYKNEKKSGSGKDSNGYYVIFSNGKRLDFDNKGQIK